MSMFNTKFFYVETKFSLAELSLIRQHLEEYLDRYVKRFYDKALKSLRPVEEDVLVNFASILCSKNIVFSWRTCHTCFF